MVDSSRPWPSSPHLQVGRYALYDELAGISLVLYDPTDSGKFKSDLFSADMLGTAYNWVQPSLEGARDVSNFEVFYRFPIFPEADATFSYQAIVNPALDPSNDSASVFSFRIRSIF